MASGCWSRRLAVARVGWRRALCSSLGTAAALILMAPDATAGPCTSTTSTAFQACLADAVDNFHIAKGVCFNLADAAEREDCLAEARSSRQDDLTLCRQQRHARGELCQALGEDAYDPDFDPANFVDPTKIGRGVKPNPYFPLVKGYQWVYDISDPAGAQTDTMIVTGRTKLIEGVTCLVVTDQVAEEGVVTEDTDDWYAQDKDGNVWYCGEISKTLETFEGDKPEVPELVDIEGSWKTGREGAKPGILIEFAPKVGDVFRQEFELGTAEDAAEVKSTTDSTQAAPKAGVSCSGDCLETREFSSLEPDTEEFKYYKPGVGQIVGVEGDIRTELVKFTKQ
jgi:hypothetical protein